MDRRKLFWVAMLAIAQPSLAGIQTYPVRLLGGFPGGTWLEGAAINNSGQVVGSANLPDGSYHGMLLSAGPAQDLGTFPGGTVSSALGINAQAEVVGLAYLTNSMGYHGFLYSKGQMHDLGSLPFNAPIDNASGEQIAPAGNSAAHSINDNGEIVGVSDILGGGYHAVLWSNGVLIDLGTLGGESSDAGAINNSGQIAGGAQTPENVWHPYLYTPGQGFHDLGTLPGGVSASANGLNGAGDVVGWSTTTDGTRHAFLFREGRMRDLGLLPGIPSTEASAINRFGQVVGTARGGSGYKRSLKAFIYDAGELHDLNSLIPADSGWLLTEARSINDFGQIVAIGQQNGGSPHAVLLVPEKDAGPEDTGER